MKFETPSKGRARMNRYALQAFLPGNEPAPERIRKVLLGRGREDQKKLARIGSLLLAIASPTERLSLGQQP